MTIRCILKAFPSLRRKVMSWRSFDLQVPSPHAAFRSGMILVGFADMVILSLVLLKRHRKRLIWMVLVFGSCVSL